MGVSFGIVTPVWSKWFTMTSHWGRYTIFTYIYLVLFIISQLYECEFPLWLRSASSNSQLYIWPNYHNSPTENSWNFWLFGLGWCPLLSFQWWKNDVMSWNKNIPSTYWLGLTFPVTLSSICVYIYILSSWLGCISSDMPINDPPYIYIYRLVVSTPLKNMSQLGWLFTIYIYIYINIWQYMESHKSHVPNH